MLKIKSLKFKNIGRFVEEQFIDFTKLGNLIQLDADNKNTKGSSGSGKTTVFNALDYLLGLNDLSNNILQSRLTKDAILVEGEFEYDGKPLRIVRGKKLLINEDGKVTTGSSDLTEKELDRILGMPRDVFRPMLHKRQKEGGFFLKFTPREMNDFLIDCLDLSESKKNLEKVEKRIKELEDNRTHLGSKLANWKGSLQATQDAIVTLGLAPIRDMHPEVVQQLKSKLNASKATHRDVEARHNLERETLENSRPQVKVSPYDRSKIDLLEKDLQIIRKKSQELINIENSRQTNVNRHISDLKLQIKNLEFKIANGNKAKEEAPLIANEIKKIRNNMCPTCEQGWVTDKAKEREAQLMAKIGSLKETIGAGAKASETMASALLDLKNLQFESMPKEQPEVANLAQKETEIGQLTVVERNNEKEHNKIQNEQNRLILDAFSVKQSLQRTIHQKELEQSMGQFGVDDKAYQASYMKLKAYEEAKDRYEKSINQLKTNESTYLDSVKKAEDDIYSFNEELLLAEESRRCIKSYISCSFDDALISISDKATKIIGNIPNMANAVIQLEGIRETKDGKIKEEVNAVINMDGEESVPIKSLSGGERTAVDLAVDLAVIDYIENKTNKGCDFFILDEPFQALDTVSIEMVLEVLKNSNIDKRLVLVDHNELVKEMVQSRVVVVREGLTSNILVA